MQNLFSTAIHHFCYHCNATIFYKDMHKLMLQCPNQQYNWFKHKILNLHKSLQGFEVSQNSRLPNRIVFKLRESFGYRSYFKMNWNQKNVQCKNYVEKVLFLDLHHQFGIYSLGLLSGFSDCHRPSMVLYKYYITKKKIIQGCNSLKWIYALWYFILGKDSTNPWFLFRYVLIRKFMTHLRC